MKDKSVMISIQPYWAFLIIAKKMGWDIDKEKTIEVRKTFPKDENWNKEVVIYCSKDKKSFNLIPKYYQPLMEKFLGKVVGKWVCDYTDIFHEWELSPCKMFYKKEKARLDLFLKESCLSHNKLCEYRKNLSYIKPLYGWHISDLKIYDKPRALSEFKTPTDCESGIAKAGLCNTCCLSACFCSKKPNRITRPPQSWCYTEVI